MNNDRTQSSEWIYDEDLAIAERISRRLDLVTGLHVSKQDFERYPTGMIESEALQVGIYGPGGLFMPHVDAFESLDVRY